MKHSTVKFIFFPIITLVSCPFLYGHELSSADRWVSVAARGEVDAVPDMATLRLGVASNAKTSTLATESNSQSIRRIFKVLSEKGVQ